jgi:hypothetical protein
LQRTKDIAAIATPILIVLVGGYLEKSRVEDAAKLSNSLALMQDEREAAGQRIEQSHLLSSLMGPLLSEEIGKKQLAINIALYACGEEGRKIVSAISQSNPGSRSAEYAKRLIESRRRSLIDQLIAPLRGDRWNAAEELGSAWAGDPSLIPELIAFADRNASVEHAVYNAITVFADLPSRSLVSHKSELIEFLSKSERSVPETGRLVGIVRNKLVEPSSEPPAG